MLDDRAYTSILKAFDGIGYHLGIHLGIRAKGTVSNDRILRVRQDIGNRGKIQVKTYGF